MGILISKIFGKLIGSKEVAVKARVSRAGCPGAQLPRVPANQVSLFISRFSAAAAPSCSCLCMCLFISMHGESGFFFLMGRHQVRILILGLDNAGKTTILYRLHQVMYHLMIHTSKVPVCTRIREHMCVQTRVCKWSCARAPAQRHA